MKIIVSCEHGGNKIPQEFQEYFANDLEVLKTHRGIDIGALAVAEMFAKNADFFIFSDVSRLVVDLNRSPHHKNLFSQYTKILDPDVKMKILSEYYTSYRKDITAKIEQFIQDEPVLHVSVHSFTPVLNNVTRTADVGLLFDPRRPLEKKFCRLWKINLQERLIGYKIRFNYPYLGTLDGLTTSLRKLFKEDQYLGIEVELNQNLFHETSVEQMVGIIREKITDSFFTTVDQFEESMVG